MMTKALLSAMTCLLLGLTQDSVTASTQQSVHTRGSFILGGLSWSNDSSQIAVGTDDGVFVHEADNLMNVYQVIEARFVTALDWHPTYNWIATGHASPTEEPTRVWDVSTKTVLFTVESELVTQQTRWSSNGRYLASTGYEAIIHLLDVEDEEVDRIIIPPYSYSGLLSWSDDGEQFVTQYSPTPLEGGLHVYNVNSREVQVYWTFTITTPSLAWSPVNSTIATYSVDDQLRLWDADDGRLLQQVEIAGRSSYGLTWSPDGARIVLYISTCADTSCNQKDERLNLIDVQRGEIIARSEEVSMIGDGFYQNAIEYSPDGTRIATISDDGRLLILSADDLSTLAVYDDYQPL